jgi:hypothetical protein
MDERKGHLGLEPTREVPTKIEDIERELAEAGQHQGEARHHAGRAED